MNVGEYLRAIDAVKPFCSCEDDLQTAALRVWRRQPELEGRDLVRYTMRVLRTVRIARVRTEQRERASRLQFDTNRISESIRVRFDVPQCSVRHAGFILDGLAAGMTYQEMGKVLGVSRARIGQKVAQIRAELRGKK